MIKKSAALMIPLLALVVFGSAIPVKAQVTANSCSYTDVQNAVNSVARGGTVTVPSGNCSWSSTLTLTGGITLQGAGVGSTVITSTQTHVMDISPDSTAIANEETIRVSGFTFDGSNTAAQFINLSGAPANGTKPYKTIIIDNNKFQNEGGGGGDPAIWLGGEYRGVIYKNTFDRCNMIIRPMGTDQDSEWTNPAYVPFSYGSSDQLFFEDNTILWSSSYSDHGNTGMLQSEQGGRVVARFNTWNNTNFSGSEIVDVHGFQNYPNGQTSTMIVEYYDNTFTDATNSIFRIINHRGSWGMFFDNTYTGGQTPSINVDQYGPPNTGCNGATGHPNGEVNNTYAFHNLINGSVTPMTAGPANACSVTENHNPGWYNQNNSFNGTVGIGRGTKAQLNAITTCTTGVGYWVTDEGSWNTKLPANTSGQFYKCTATNTWTLYYTPYPYPHPLRTGSSSSSIGPLPPTNLRAVVQ